MTDSISASSTDLKPNKPQGLELLLLRTSQIFAYLGGIVLLALTLMTVYSVIGRTIVKTDWLSAMPFLSWWRPVRGDFELIEIGTAIAIASFFPYCHMVRGNVLVDFFTSQAHPRVKSAMAILANVIFSVVSILITWRMIVGSNEFYTAVYKQSSMILKIPTYIGMFIVTGFMVLLSMVCLFTLYRSTRETLGSGEPSESMA